MLLGLIRTLWHTARTFMFMAVGGFTFYLAFSYIFIPTLILSGISTTIAAVSAFVYNDSMAILLVNIARHIYEIALDVEYDEDMPDFNLNTVDAQAKFILGAPFFALGLALVTSGTAAFYLGAKLSFGFTYVVDYLTWPITRCLNLDEEPEEEDEVPEEVDPEFEEDIYELVGYEDQDEDDELNPPPSVPPSRFSNLYAFTIFGAAQALRLSGAEQAPTIDQPGQETIPPARPWRFW